MIIKIGKKTISDNHQIYIIAEAGINHNGSFETAKKMIDIAKKSGVDAIKFQMYHLDEIVSDSADLVNYQKNGKFKNQKEMLKQYELSDKQFYDLKRYCDRIGITFLATPFDFHSASKLNEMNVDAFKISSGDITNLALINKIAEYKKPIILSTGMSSLKEIEDAINSLPSSSSIAILHCTSAYPARFDELNLNVINTLKNAFKKIIGYSDHSLGLEIPYAITSMGYKIIEKHFTLNKNSDGPDHRISLEPDELKQMVNGIRNIEKALGSSVKKITSSEEELKPLVRKGIYISRDLEVGHILSSDDLLYLRPSDNIDASKYLYVIGKKLKVNKKKNQPLLWEDVF